MSWGIAFRLRQQLKGSLYALPVLGALLGPVLGQLTLWLDRSVQLPEGPPAVIGRREAHGRGVLRDREGRPRVVLPVGHWEQYLDLGVTEIRQYGARSVQVTRRLRALLEELRSGVLPERRAAVDAELCRLEASVAASFADSDDRSLAGESDRQGIGGPARPRPG